MGIISVIKDFIESRKQKKELKLLEDETTKRLERFIAEFKETETIEDLKERRREQELLIRMLSYDVSSGSIDIGGNEQERAESPMLIIERHFTNNHCDVSESVCGGIKSIKIDGAVTNILNALVGENVDISKIEDMLEDYNKLVGQETKGVQMREMLAPKDRKIQLIEFVEKHATIRASMYINIINRGYTRYYAQKIREASDFQEQERLYDEYVRDFLGGTEDPKDLLVSIVKNAPFYIEREEKRKYERNGLTYDPKNPIVIYEVNDENSQKVKAANRARAAERMNKEVTARDLVLVRTTNFLPRHRIVEPVGKHSKPLMDGSFFGKEIEQAGLNPEDYKMAAFVTRETVHWALNALVGSHDGGNFENRRFIIIEPFEEQQDNPGLVNINEADTYFNGPVKLSQRATILIPVEVYKEVMADPEQSAVLSEYNIRVFSGDEEMAVNMFLQEQGYVFGDIGKWGFRQSSETPEEEYCLLHLRKVMLDIATNKKIKFAGVHSNTEVYIRDMVRRSEYMDKRLNDFVHLLHEESGVNFSEQHLKAMLMARIRSYEASYSSQHFQEHYNRCYADYTKDTPELEGEEHMSPEEVFAAIGPEKLRELTQMYNAMIFEEHEAARAARDKELIAQGWLTEEELEPKTPAGDYPGIE